MPLRALHACAIAAVAALAPVLALAADLPPAHPVVRPPPVVTAAPYSWYGFYIGIQGGYGFGGKAITYAPNASYAGIFAAGAVPGPMAEDPQGGIGGVTYGSNFQFGRLVVGMESDWSYSDIRRRETLGPLAGASVRVTAEQSVKWFSTSRGRAGVLMTDHWLVYGTGGLASASTESTSAFNLVAPAACAGAGNCPTGTRAIRRYGWTAGGGMEFASGPWSLKAEYLYYDLATTNYRVIDPTLPGGAIIASNKFSGSIVRAGLNYRFNWTLLDLVRGGL